MRVHDKRSRCPSHAFYRINPATSPATARTLIELPLINCAAPFEVLVDAEPVLVPEGDEPEEPAEPEEPDEPLAAAVTAAWEALPLTETTALVAPAVPERTVPEGFSLGAGSVALVPCAASWKASKLLFAVGLTAKTIPASQCVPVGVVWLQKNHNGAEAFSTVRLQVGNEEPVGSETFWKPELTPFAVQGEVKDD